MTGKPGQILRRYASNLAAVGLIFLLYGLARLPEISQDERDALASRFSFARLPLPELSAAEYRLVRPVHPSLERISAWISAVGGAVALNDLDGDGLPNDVCYVETRTDQVIVAPVPGTTARYEPFALDPGPLPYSSATMAPMGCLPGDLNEDGLIDVLVYYWGRTPIAFLRNPPDSVSSDRPLSSRSWTRCEIVPDRSRWFTNAVTRADLDGDGHPDLIIGNFFQDDAGILDVTGSAREAMQHSMSRAYNAGRNRFLLWTESTKGSTPSVRFREAAGALDGELALGWTLAIGAADLDGDLLPEVYFANDFGPDLLLHNRSRPGELEFAVLSGEKRLTTPNSKVLGRDSFKGMGVDFGDLNGDGWLDLYVSNIAEEYALEESHFVWISTGDVERMREGVAPYVDQSEPLGLSRSGWGWESRLADFDNDGVLEAIQATGFMKGDVNRWPELQELALGNDELLSDPRTWPRLQPGDDISGWEHNPFFVRAQDGRYYDIASDLGIDQPMVSRGIATADVDGDGDLDFAVGNQWEPSWFYRNEQSAGTSLILRLLVPLHPGEHTQVIPGHPPTATLGRPAIGAQATVNIPDRGTLVAQVDGGNGHSGKRSPELHFGLGSTDRDAPLEVELHWRDPGGRRHQETINLTPGRHTVVLSWPDGREGL